MNDIPDIYETAATETVELANRLAADAPDNHPWDVADGLLAGAVHYWLYSRQPCGDPMCEDCAPVATAEQRVAELKRVVEQMAQDSDYYHAPTDVNVGRA
ncbi:hypothetical protein [Thioalkalivibrio thiocyanodenitrificans]|jgi:hypothetical protein|uniref:hypothetical protein n=1 Tax=Thioalkalivibrio thiocyanodenitrificans TaxID=243063 RepID=UPI0003677F21|nr:hypothetical protein [Thioalkalivibrio thiocyanodenitrificans]